MLATNEKVEPLPRALSRVKFEMLPSKLQPKFFEFDDCPPVLVNSGSLLLKTRRIEHRKVFFQAVPQTGKRRFDHDPRIGGHDGCTSR
jgi:hypothetical protein